MYLNKNEVNQILRTLPIGYYAKTGIAVECVDGCVCYFDNHSDKIVIGYELINSALKKVDDDFNSEVAVRTILYHEVSHMIMSPIYYIENSKYYCCRFQRVINEALHIVLSDAECHDLINIFEDERIESVLKNYYLRTDFKWFVKTQYDGSKPTDVRSIFYYAVRYRICDDQNILNMISAIIATYKTITRNHCYADESGKGLDEYFEDIAKVYIACYRLNEKSNDEESNQNEQGDEQNENDETNNESSNNAQPMANDNPDESDESDDDNESEETSNDESENEKSDDDEFDNNNNVEGDGEQSQNVDDEALDNEVIDKLFEKAFCVTRNDAMSNEFRRIFKQFKTRGNVGGHTNAYSGVINPRNIGNKDYKYFTRTNTENNGGAGKLHLNLWIDCSGSYSRNVEVTNQIIKSLEMVEKENKIFTFDVIEINWDVIVHDKSNRYIEASGGNKLSYEYFETFRHMQKPDARNYNIVLYDGVAWYHRDELSNFKAWNHDNVFIISDEDNAKHIKTKCKSAKTLFVTRQMSWEKSYATLLSEKIYDILKIAFGA